MKSNKVKAMYISTEYDLNNLLCGKLLINDPKIYIFEDDSIAIEFAHRSGKVCELVFGRYYIDSQGDYEVVHPPYQDYGDELDTVKIIDDEIVFEFSRPEGYRQIRKFKLS